MRKMSIEKGRILYRKGEAVNGIAVLLKGSFSLQDEDISLTADSGAMLGAFCPAGGTYRYDYMAAEDSVLAVYDYDSGEDVASIIGAAPAIAPAMAAASVALACRLADALASLQEQGECLCRDLKADYKDYQGVCAALMLAPRPYEEIHALLPPDEPEVLSGWQVAFFRACRERDALLRKEYYPADLNFCIGTIQQAAQLAQALQPQIEAACAFLARTRQRTDDFSREYHAQKAKLDEARRQEAIRAGSGNLPQIKNALNTILAFADAGRDVADAFAKDIRRFQQCPDKTEKSDEMRRLRQSITKNFYAIYEAAFFRSLETGQVPPEVRMFFLFGFVDEGLAGAEHTAALYRYAMLWEGDANGRVLPACEWLRMIYRGDAPPSKDEFDNEWPEHLKEEVRQGLMTQKQADEALHDGREMVRFELGNMVANANRMTFGSLASFVPVFYAQAATRPLESCLASVERVSGALQRIRSIDFGCFYRPAFVPYTQYKINRFDYNREVLPYFILMPNCGSRGVMWQEIEGRRRTTPAHMVLSILHTEDLDNTMVQMCAQFRWEMCKRIQGVHYSDMTDPSLTAEYINYLQFYRKNHDLSADMKEKVKTALKRSGNSYGKVFAAEYAQYVNCESEGLPRLNKVARGILFRYCTLARKYRESLHINPQYRPLIERWNVQHDDKERTLELFTRKILSMTDTLPEEVRMEMEYLKL